MSKKQGDFVNYVRNNVVINAIAVYSRDVFTPETQTAPASTIEHLTLVYLDPASASSSLTGEQLRNSVKVQYDVPPLVEGQVNGWMEVLESQTQTVAAPLPATPESVSAQNEHDRSTGNVNEANQTPAEAVAAEQQQAAETVTDAEKDALVEAASAPVPDAPAGPSVGIGQVPQ